MKMIIVLCRPNMITLAQMIWIVLDICIYVKHIIILSCVIMYNNDATGVSRWVLHRQ
jgi:hypothetical protein